MVVQIAPLMLSMRPSIDACERKKMEAKVENLIFDFSQKQKQENSNLSFHGKSINIICTRSIAPKQIKTQNHAAAYVDSAVCLLCVAEIYIILRPQWNR